ncbi:MAG TPA: hypothetical protein VM869_28445 [Enhygromyxa sp.]|nr:hypothetical protein [Enhygromyxa sp.]
MNRIETEHRMTERGFAFVALITKVAKRSHRVFRVHAAHNG